MTSEGAAPGRTAPDDATNSTQGTELARLLEALGRDSRERLSVSTMPGGRFSTVLTTVAEAPELVDPAGDCWYGVAALDPALSEGRGAAKDVVGVRELYADLDVKVGGLPSFAAAEAVVAELSAMLGTVPVAVVHSGHGLQPHWALERDQTTDWPDSTDSRWTTASALFRRWGRLVAHVAEKHGGAVDNVYDLSRVLRVPGTVNRKDTPVHVTVVWPEGGPVELKRLAEVLDEMNVPEAPEDRERLDEELSAPSSWKWAEVSCGYSATMVKGWKGDKPTERHPWLVAQAIRLVSAFRLGCLTEEDYGAAKAVLVEKFRTRLNVGRKRKESPGEVAGAFSWAVARVSTYSDDRAREELGKHRHGAPPPPEQSPADLDAVHEVFHRWLGDDYDTDVLDAVLASAASGLKSEGDVVNLLVVGGSGAAKTETVGTLAAGGALVVSTISSEGALLSGTSAKERGSAATGGLLRQVGERGTLVMKDVTTILSMHRDSQAAILAALREVADGLWVRNLGVDGGTTLRWTGRCTLIGAVTTSWDQHHAVVGAMGDRFLLVRMPEDNALASGRQAMANAGKEVEMRAELAAVVGGLLQHLPEWPDAPVPDGLLELANLVTWGRTAVITDYKGNVEEAHAREAPTRLAKQLYQLYRGCLAIGHDADDALRIVVRVAGDTLPPRRRAILRGLADLYAPASSTEVAHAIDRPRTSTDQGLQALQALRLVTTGPNTDGGAWTWQLSRAVDRTALRALVGGQDCVACGFRLDPIEPGQTIHPNCEAGQ